MPDRARSLLRSAFIAFILLFTIPPTGRVEGEGSSLLDPDRRWVERTLRSLSLRDKISQLIQIRVYGRFLNRDSPEYLEIEDQIRRNRVGGVILFAGQIYESAVLLNDLQKASRLPLIVSADFERGAAFRIADTTSFPWTMAVGAAGSEELAYRQGAITAQEARALGVHWIFAPVMDVNNNPDNPVINIRSYGEDPALVARMGAAFIRGARHNGVLTTAKHFPGHGDTAVDSHIGLAVVPSDLARLEAVELVPFRAAIDAGVDSIMTAHVAVPRATGEAGTPATLSSRILTDMLKTSLGFQGLVVTDAMEMGAITSRSWSGRAAVQAIQAGADLVLLPPDTDVAIEEILRAVERGDISEQRISRSVEKLLLAKTRLGLHRKRTVEIERIGEMVARPDSAALALDIADRSMTLLRDKRRVLPLDPIRPPKLFSMVLSSDPDTNPGSVFQAELRRRFPGARTAALDNRASDDALRGALEAARQADIIVCATIVRVISGRGSVALPAVHHRLVGEVLALGKPVVWIAFGNPYVLRSYPQLETYLCTFSYADVSQTAAAKALSGEIEISGRMPVSIPRICEVGEGLSVPRRSMVLTSATPASHGLGPDAFREAESLLSRYVEEKVFPGAVLLVGYRGSIVLEAPAGRLEYSPDSDAVTPDTMYDLASLSKAVGSASAVMMLVESGRLRLEAPVQEYLPEFRGEGKAAVQVHHLLSHSSGLSGPLRVFQQASGYDEILKIVMETPLRYEPGTRTQYSDLGMILLGEIIARTSGMPLDRLLAKNLFTPLGMKSTMYNPSKDLRSRIAPTENDPWRQRMVHGEVHDENAYAMRGVAGHAGLFGSARDLAVFAQMMLNLGIYDHRRFFRPETISRFTAVQQKDGDRAMGWAKPSKQYWTGEVFAPAAYGHTGFTGTSLWIDPDRQLFIVLLSNRVHPSRNSPRIDEVREMIARAVVKAIDARPARPAP